MRFIPAVSGVQIPPLLPESKSPEAARLRGFFVPKIRSMIFPPESGRAGERNILPRISEHFQFETRNHTACRFAEKACFSAQFGPGGSVLPPRVSPFLKLKRSLNTPAPPEKARWGRDGGLGGKDYQSAFPLETAGPSRASSDRMAAAGRAHCDEESYGHRQQR